MIAEVETDKATMEWESQEDGFIAKLLKPDGTKDIPIGTNLVVLVEDEASVAAFKDYKEGGGYTKNPSKNSSEKPYVVLRTCLLPPAPFCFP